MCARCGAEMRVIALIEKPAAIQRIGEQVLVFEQFEELKARFESL